jgi:DNA-binding response OmpR family regulator
MPGLDGWGFALGLEERQVRFPILVMTAGVHDGSWASEIGADGWLSKPFDVDDLIDRVKLLLRPEGADAPALTTHNACVNVAGIPRTLTTG